MDPKIVVKEQQVREVNTAMTVSDLMRNQVGPVIITAHEDFYKLLAYAGPPPKDDLTRGISRFSAYTPWVRQVGKGLRTLHPHMDQTQLYLEVIKFTDWCRQQGMKAND